MKRLFFTSLLGCISFLVQSQTATVKATTNGIAPIARFTLNQPAVLVFVNTKFAKNWEFDPDITFDLSNGNGWFADTWVKRIFKLDTTGKLVAIVGVDWSLFFQPYVDGKKITQSVVYPTFEYMMRYVPNEKNALVFDYWYTFATQKEFGVKGNYLSLSYTRTQPFKAITLYGNATNLYINYSDGSKGFGMSYDMSVQHNKSGLFAGFQMIHSLSQVDKTGMKFAWNASIGITRKLF